MVALGGVGIGRNPRLGAAQQWRIHGEPRRDWHAREACPVLVERSLVRAAVTACLLMGGVHQIAIIDIDGKSAGQPGRRSGVARIGYARASHKQVGRCFWRSLSDCVFPNSLPPVS